MSLTPAMVIRRALLRIGAYRGDPAAIEASYIKTDPTDDAVSESFVPSAFTDELTSVEQEIAGAAASNKDQVWRGLIADVTASIANGGLIPTVGASTATAKIIGEYGQVREAVTPFRPLTPDMTEADIRAFAENPGSMFISDVFSYSLRKPRLNHTRPNAIIDVCVFDYAARLAAITANEALLFQSAANAYFAGLMSLLKNTDATLTELSAVYEPRYRTWLAGIAEGGTADLQEA